jgi:hypothetical protein
MSNDAWNKDLTARFSDQKPLVIVTFSPLAHSARLSNMKQMFYGGLIGNAKMLSYNLW